jgi:hypothetical protein
MGYNDGIYTVGFFFDGQNTCPIISISKIVQHMVIYGTTGWWFQIFNQEFFHGMALIRSFSETVPAVPTYSDIFKPINIRFIFQHLPIPSGKLLHNYRKSPFLMDKSTINSHFQ